MYEGPGGAEIRNLHVGFKQVSNSLHRIKTFPEYGSRQLNVRAIDMWSCLLMQDELRYWRICFLQYHCCSAKIVTHFRMFQCVPAPYVLRLHIQFKEQQHLEAWQRVKKTQYL